MIKLMFVIANEPRRPVTEVRPGLSRPPYAIDDVAGIRDFGSRYRYGAAMAEALRDAAARLA